MIKGLSSKQEIAAFLQVSFSYLQVSLISSVKFIRGLLAEIQPSKVVPELNQYRKENLKFTSLLTFL